MLHRGNFLMNLVLLLKTCRLINSFLLAAFSTRHHLMEDGESTSVIILSLPFYIHLFCSEVILLGWFVRNGTEIVVGKSLHNMSAARF